MIKGQLGFDEFLNISEEEQTNKEVETRPIRVPMADPCYYCLCNSCVNNVENIRVKPNDIYCDWKPCFQCDNCRIYDGDSSKKNMEVDSCGRYAIDNYHAARNRKKFKLVRGKND